MERESTLQGMLHTEEKLFLPGEMISTEVNTKGDKTSVTVTQQFWNPTQAPCGLFYFYPLPPNAKNPGAKFRLEPHLPESPQTEESWRASAKELPELESFPEELYGFALKALQPRQKITVELTYEWEQPQELDHNLLVLLPPLHGALQMEPSALDEMLPPKRKETTTTKFKQQLNAAIVEFTRDTAEAKRLVKLLTEDEQRLKLIYQSDEDTSLRWVEIIEGDQLEEDADRKKLHALQAEEHTQRFAESKKAYLQQREKANQWREQLRRLEEMLLEAKRQLAFLCARENVNFAEETRIALLQRQEKLGACLRVSEPGEPITVADIEREEILEGQARHFKDLATAWGIGVKLHKDKDEARYQESLKQQQEYQQQADDYLQQYLQQKQKNETKPTPSKVEPPRKSFDFVTRFKDASPSK